MCRRLGEVPSMYYGLHLGGVTVSPTLPGYPASTSRPVFITARWPYENIFAVLPDAGSY